MYLRRVRMIAVIAVLAGACAARGTPGTADPDAAAAAIRATAPDRPLMVVFDWTILEGDARFSGSGAARTEPPYRARLDLFGPRGEGYLSAAVVGRELRLPGGAPEGVLPAPAMLWAVLGVVSPPPRAVLAGTRTDGERTELHYAVGESRLRYTLERGRLRAARWDGEGRRMAVELSGDAGSAVPAEVFYRDRSAGTELMLEVERVDEVEPYPSEIWTPDA